MRVINKVTVIGANGTMGANVAGIFASFGNAKVYMVCRNLEKADMAVKRVVRSVRADSIRSNLIPVDYSKLQECVLDSDLVFESVAENLEAKIAVNQKLAEALRTCVEAPVICSGTSGLSVNALAECFPEALRRNYFGVHMFNPPYNMPLCELITTKYSDQEILGEIRNYLENVLFRTVVKVKDAPAFLANRIGFQFINEALQCAERYQDKGGIDYVDAILGTFSGRAMPPLATADFVGLDIHKAIVDNLWLNTKDYAHATYSLPEFVQKLISEGRLGRKAGAGLFKTEITLDGKRRQYVYDIATDEYREKRKYTFAFADKMAQHIQNAEYEKVFQVLVTSREEEARICLHFLLSYIVYSLVMAKEIGDSIHSADDVMATGFNWCPPLALVDVLSEVTDVRVLIEEQLDPGIVHTVDLGVLFANIERSKYDFRPYFKSGI